MLKKKEITKKNEQDRKSAISSKRLPLNPFWCLVSTVLHFLTIANPLMYLDIAPAYKPAI